MCEESPVFLGLRFTEKLDGLTDSIHNPGKFGAVTEDTVRPLIKRGEHEETPGFQNFAVFCPLCIVRGTGVCRTHIEVGYLVVARGTGWG